MCTRNVQAFDEEVRTCDSRPKNGTNKQTAPELLHSGDAIGRLRCVTLVLNVPFIH